MSDTLGFGLISLLFGIYILVDRDELARYFARSQETMQRLLRIDLGAGEPREEQRAQKCGVVVLGAACMVLGIVMFVISGYWWVTP